MKRPLMLFALLATPLSAETRLTAEEFEARVTGRTLSYATGGAAYGAEEYLDGRRVRWSFLDGECQEGTWFAEGGQVCFVYDNTPTPQCWSFYLREGQLYGRFENRPEAVEFYEVARRAAPLACIGPEVGV